MSQSSITASTFFKLTMLLFERQCLIMHVKVRMDNCCFIILRAYVLAFIMFLVCRFRRRLCEFKKSWHRPGIVRRADARTTSAGGIKYV